MYININQFLNPGHHCSVVANIVLNIFVRKNFSLVAKTFDLHSVRNISRPLTSNCGYNTDGVAHGLAEVLTFAFYWRNVSVNTNDVVNVSNFLVLESSCQIC